MSEQKNKVTWQCYPSNVEEFGDVNFPVVNDVVNLRQTYLEEQNHIDNLREGSIGEEDIGSRIFHTDKGECWLVGWMQNGETVRVILKFDDNKLDETLPLNVTKMRKLIK